MSSDCHWRCHLSTPSSLPLCSASAQVHRRVALARERLNRLTDAETRGISHASRTCSAAVGETPRQRPYSERKSPGRPWRYSARSCRYSPRACSTSRCHNASRNLCFVQSLPAAAAAGGSRSHCFTSLRNSPLHAHTSSGPLSLALILEDGVRSASAEKTPLRPKVELAYLW
jgi:hypothetical protein